MKANSTYENLSKLNLIASCIGILLILIPFILIGLLSLFDKSNDTDMLFMISTILITCSIPMIIVVISLYFAVFIFSVIALTKGICRGKNLAALIISIVATIVSIIGSYYFFKTSISLIDTISRLG